MEATKYQYCELTMPITGGIKIDFINAQAKEGWELVTIDTETTPNRFYFKKPIVPHHADAEEKLRQALNILKVIAEPSEYLKEAALAVGGRINWPFFQSLRNDPNWLRSLAEEVLLKLDPPKEHHHLKIDESKL